MLIYNSFRILLYPLVRYLLPLLVRSLRKRVILERLYPYRYDFTHKVIFHISSEGELEQSLPLIKHYAENKQTLVVFTSGSVEKKAVQLKESYRNIEICCLPALRYFPLIKRLNPSLWKAEIFFMCRYDFFPELLFLARKTKKAILLNTSFKNLLKAGALKKRYYQFAYDSFEHMFLASDLEMNYLDESGIKINASLSSFDFRLVQIQERVQRAEKHICERFKHGEALLELLNKRAREEKLILGSYWETEFSHLEGAIRKALGEGKLIFCAPHSLGKEGLGRVRKVFEQNDIAFSDITEDMTEAKLRETFAKVEKENGVMIIDIKGILCELYTLFGCAYIAGGFHKSIHSVLEPYIAGVDHIWCGPNTHRSSEFDLVRSDSNNIESFNKIGDFFSYDLQLESKQKDYNSSYQNILSELQNL